MLLVLFRSFVLVWFLFTAVVSVGSFLGGSKVAADGFVLIYGRRCRRRPKQCSFCSLRLSQTLLDRLHQRRCIQFRFCVSNLTSYHRIAVDCCPVFDFLILFQICWDLQGSKLWIYFFCTEFDTFISDSILCEWIWNELARNEHSCCKLWIGEIVIVLTLNFRYRSSRDEYVLVYDLL